MRRITKQQLALDVTDRGHILLHFPSHYKSVKDKVRFKCLTCNEEWETSVHSYRTSKSGCPSCKKETASLTHKGKNVSEETRLLIGKKASARPGSLRGVTGIDHPAWKGGYGRNKSQQSSKDYEWKNAVKKRCKNQCIVTGEKKDLVCHHIDGWNLFPNRRHDISNGVLLKKDIHKMFHDANSYGNNTEDQFKTFLLNYFQLDWQKIKADLQHGNHQPSSLKSLSPKGEEVGEKVQRLEGEELNQ